MEQLRFDPAILKQSVNVETLKAHLVSINSKTLNYRIKLMIKVYAL
jgi:hypothetical protein